MGDDFVDAVLGGVEVGTMLYLHNKHWDCVDGLSATGSARGQGLGILSMPETCPQAEQPQADQANSYKNMLAIEHVIPFADP